MSLLPKKTSTDDQIDQILDNNLLEEEKLEDDDFDIEFDESGYVDDGSVKKKLLIGLGIIGGLVAIIFILSLLQQSPKETVPTEPQKEEVNVDGVHIDDVANVGQIEVEEPTEEEPEQTESETSQITVSDKNNDATLNEYDFPDYPEDAELVKMDMDSLEIYKREGTGDYISLYVGDKLGNRGIINIDKSKYGGDEPLVKLLDTNDNEELKNRLYNYLDVEINSDEFDQLEVRYLDRYVDLSRSVGYTLTGYASDYELLQEETEEEILTGVNNKQEEVKKEDTTKEDNKTSDEKNNSTSTQKENKLTSLKAVSSTVNLEKGKTYDIDNYFNTKPVDYSGKLSYNSQDSSIVKVSSDGKITVVGYGKCKLTVSGGNLQASIIVNVNHTHNWNVTSTTNPTCIKEGSTLYTCSLCNSTKQDILVKINHDFSVLKVDKKPTCTEYGSQSYHCRMCDKPSEPQQLNLIPHNYESTITKPVSCSEDGIETFTCTGCGDSYTRPIISEGHDYVETMYTNPSGTNIAKKKFTCNICGHFYELEFELTDNSTGTIVDNNQNNQVDDSNNENLNITE